MSVEIPGTHFKLKFNDVSKLLRVVPNGNILPLDGKSLPQSDRLTRVRIF